MRSVLKMVLLVLVLLFMVNYDGRPGNVIPVMPEQVHVAPQLPPPPPDWEDIRRQRNVERSLNTEWLKESTRKYSPDSWYLLMSYESLPVSSSAPLLDGGEIASRKSAETFAYLKGRTRIDLLVSMEMNVHEIAHAYYDQNVFRYLAENKIDFNPDNANGFIYITPRQSYFVSFPLKALFPSEELASVIPSSLRTYRYDTYIKGTTSTQSDGVLGLLNELHAYYCGSRYCFDMLEPYKTAAGSDASGLFEWVTHTQSTMSAFYEFSFFMSEYLLFMKRKYPANYEMLLSYSPFRESYASLTELYNDLIARYLDRIKKEMDLLNSSGEAEAGLRDGWLWIRSGNSHISNGTPLFSDERKTLLPVLEGRRYKEIKEDFRMKQYSEGNR
jgi:hypothetical protein